MFWNKTNYKEKAFFGKVMKMKNFVKKSNLQGSI